MQRLAHGPSSGNLLWKVVPRADLAGVEASAEDRPQKES
jgi:hypothetical protein